MAARHGGARLSRRALLGATACTLALPHPAHAWAAQTSSAEDMLTRQGRYLPRWFEILDEPAERQRLLSALGADQAQHVDRVLRDVKTQHAAFLGDEAVALTEARLSSTAPAPADDLVAEDAIAAVVTASRGRRLVMLNEAHDASRHRMFLAQVIRALHDEGFRCLAAETFGSGASDLRPGSSVSHDLGWYVRDPVFAEAVREALDLGWSLAPYEQRPDQKSADLSLSDAATLTREQAQADNMRALLAAAPSSRILVFVGYGHLREKGDAFAARFKRDTGIDPLTVGQAGVGAFGPHVEDAPPTQALLATFKPQRPVVLMQRGQVPASRATDAELTPELTDLMVLHPAQPDIDGRPHWLATDALRVRTAVQMPGGQGPRLIQAVHATDPDPAIPADQFLVGEEGGAVVLYLRPGLYRLRLETRDGFEPLGDIRVERTSVST